MKRLLIGVLLITAITATATAEGFRSITSVDHYTYFQDDNSVLPEEVFLATMVPGLMLEARISGEFTTLWDRWLAQGGIVLVIMDGLYTEAVYGAGSYIDGSVYQQGFLELVFETDVLVSGLRVKLNYVNDTGEFYILPHIYSRYYFTDKFGAKLKYSFSWDNDNDISNGLNLEAQYKWTKKIQTDLVINGTYREETIYDNSQKLYYLYEFGARFTMHITPEIKVKLFENVLVDQDLGTGLQSVVTLDISF